MKHLKLFEEHKEELDQEFLINIAVNGIRNDDMKTIQFAFDRGLDVLPKFDYFTKICAIHDNFKLFKIYYSDERLEKGMYEKFFTEDGKVKDYDFFYDGESAGENYSFWTIPVGEDSSFRIYIFDDKKNEHKQTVPGIEYSFTTEDDDYNGSVNIYLFSSHLNATIESSGGTYHIEYNEEDDLPIEGRDVLEKFILSKYPNLKKPE